MVNGILVLIVIRIPQIMQYSPAQPLVTLNRL
jgi:hypothetical protein